MVVDDEKLIREVIKEYLNIEGYEVDEAQDGEEAVEKASNLLLAFFLFMLSPLSRIT